MDILERIEKRLVELQELRQQIIQQIVSQNPDVRAVDAAMGELRALLAGNQGEQKDSDDDA